MAPPLGRNAQGDFFLAIGRRSYALENARYTASGVR
jgi:hypothetical protein